MSKGCPHHLHKTLLSLSLEGGNLGDIALVSNPAVVIFAHAPKNQWRVIQKSIAKDDFPRLKKKQAKKPDNPTLISHESSFHFLFSFFLRWSKKSKNIDKEGGMKLIALDNYRSQAKCVPLSHHASNLLSKLLAGQIFIMSTPLPEANHGDYNFLETNDND